MVEAGIYLLIACALSFKPIFRMSAKALHLHAFTTHAKSMYHQGELHMTRTSITVKTQADIQLQATPPGEFRRLSEDSHVSDRGTKELVLGESARLANTYRASLNDTTTIILTSENLALR